MYNYDPKYVGHVPAKIFVGLGGVGGRAVQRIYDRLQHNETWKQYYYPCTGFIVIDTNYEDLKQFDKPDIEKFHISRPDRQSILTHLRNGNDHFLEDFCPPEYVPRNSSLGAGQIRLESRLSFYIYSELIRDTIRKTMERIIDNKNHFLRPQKTIDVVVFTSLAGGTGSGSFLPCAYLLQEEIATRGWNAILHGHLMTSQALEGTVKRELSEYIHANCYAALKELEELSRVGTDQHQPKTYIYRRPKSKNEKRTTVARPPFNWVTLVDEPVEDEIRADILTQAMADTAYLQFMTPIISSVGGEQDNYSRFMKNVTAPQIQLASASSSIDSKRLHVGYSKCYGSHGSATLVCPEKSLIDYALKQIVAHGLESQLGSISSNENDFDPRDPRWSSLSDDDKKKIINSQWLTQVESLAKQEREEIEAKKAELKHSAEIEIEFAGYWTNIVDRVNGTIEQQQAKQNENNTTDDDNSNKENLSEKSLLDQINDQITNLLPKTPSLEGTSVSATKASLSNLNSSFNKLYEQFNIAKPALQTLMKNTYKVTSDGFPISVIEYLDAPLERYIVTTLMTSKNPEIHLQTKINQLQVNIDISRKQTFDDDDFKKSTQTRFADIAKEAPLRMQADNANFYEFWKKDDDAWADDSQREINGIISKLITDTSDYFSKQVLLEALKGLNSYVIKRSKTYGGISIFAINRASEIRTEASKLVYNQNLADGEGFALSCEVLKVDYFGRIWEPFWETYLKPELEHLFKDTNFMRRTVDEAFKKEEKAAEIQKRSIDSRRILADIEKDFFNKAQIAVELLIEGDRYADKDQDRLGIPLDYMLEWEAVYMQTIHLISQDPRAEVRKEKHIQQLNKIREDLKVLQDKTHPDYPALHAKVSTYILSKLTSVRNLANILGKVKYDMIKKEDGVVPFKTAILLCAQDIYERLETKYPVLKNMFRTSNDQGVIIDNYNVKGVDRWDNQRVMAIYQAVGIIPIYAFHNIPDFHANYETIMEMGNQKPHMIHTSHRWEHTLDDLDINAFAYKSDINRGLLAKAWIYDLVKQIDGVWSIDLSSQIIPCTHHLDNIFDSFSDELNKHHVKSALKKALQDKQSEALNLPKNRKLANQLVAQKEKIKDQLLELLKSYQDNGFKRDEIEALLLEVDQTLVKM